MSEHLSVKCVLGVFVFALIAACTEKTEKKDFVTTPAQPQSIPKMASQPTPTAASVATIELPNFTTLVKKEGSAVVNISTIRGVRQSAQVLPNIPQDDPMYEFFRRFLPAPGEKEFQARSLGSGFILSQDGFILTNAHVVADTDEVIVRLTNKREYKAKIIGTDVRTDVALLKINATDLPFVRIGDPNKLEVGEWVAAIGAPFGFENSVTSGIISAKGRTLPEETYVPFIQSDVVLNPGNSGGPLFNMKGEVIGINSQIYSQTGGYMGLSFTIPIDLAMDISKQLQARGKVVRGRIGVQAQEMTWDLANSFGLDNVNGALIVMVERGGPAHKAGILPGDVIRSFDSKSVQSSADLARFVAASKPGTTVTVEDWRKGESKLLQVEVAEQPLERAVVRQKGVR